MYSRYIGLDFETYGAVNLPVHGLQRYTEDPSFTPLLASITYQILGSTLFVTENLDLTDDSVDQHMLASRLQGKTICCHNADFERRVLQTMGIDLPVDRFIDSAVIARAMGAGGHLSEAAPQLLNMDKLDSGSNLIKLFSIPGELQEENGEPWFDRRIVDYHPDKWLEFQKYCGIDSELSLQLVLSFLNQLTVNELNNAHVTMQMNETGWPVDLEVVKEMQRRYEDNVRAAELRFREMYGVVSETFFNSLKQLKEWCADRGVRCTSFDEKHVARYAERLDRKINEPGRKDVVKHNGYVAVRDLMRTKQVLGGSSLKKLQTILDTVGSDGRLRDQYFHIGAGQSYRTTGRGVQMQNLKRLAEPADMDTLFDESLDWDNEYLAQNLRQCFTSQHPAGQLVVGDFSSVESRGLAWLANEHWKVDAFRKGLDVYKVGAAKQFDVHYNNVDKTQRQFGKVGELSCGYQAGSGAVKDFASKMGVEITEGEAAKIVSDWRAANPKIEQLWWDLNDCLENVLGGDLIAYRNVGEDDRYTVKLVRVTTPQSLIDQNVRAQSIALEMYGTDGQLILRRFFHGLYRRGSDICYYKPSSKKHGPKWDATYTNPKTKQVEHHKLYGGKLTGILTQSFCRELFFNSLRKVHRWVAEQPNVQLIGQFHDEIVLDWQPGPQPASQAYVSLADTVAVLNGYMSDVGDILGFPLEADVKHSYRYIK